MVLVENCTMYL